MNGYIYSDSMPIFFSLDSFLLYFLRLPSFLSISMAFFFHTHTNNVPTLYTSAHSLRALLLIEKVPDSLVIYLLDSFALHLLFFGTILLKWIQMSFLCLSLPLTISFSPTFAVYFCFHMFAILRMLSS